MKIKYTITRNGDDFKVMPSGATLRATYALCLKLREGNEDSWAFTCTPAP